MWGRARVGLCTRESRPATRHIVYMHVCGGTCLSCHPTAAGHRGLAAAGCRGMLLRSGPWAASCCARRAAKLPRVGNWCPATKPQRTLHPSASRAASPRAAPPPPRLPGIDPGDFFNFGQTERGWREYCARVAQYRLEFGMKGQIQARPFIWQCSSRLSAALGGHAPPAVHARQPARIQFGRPRSRWFQPAYWVATATLLPLLACAAARCARCREERVCEPAAPVLRRHPQQLWLMQRIRVPRVATAVLTGSRPRCPPHPRRRSTRRRRHARRGGRLARRRATATPPRRWAPWAPTQQTKRTRRSSPASAPRWVLPKLAPSCLRALGAGLCTRGPPEGRHLGWRDEGASCKLTARLHCAVIAAPASTVW